MNYEAQRRARKRKGIHPSFALGSCGSLPMGASGKGRGSIDGSCSKHGPLGRHVYDVDRAPARKAVSHRGSIIIAKRDTLRDGTPIEGLAGTVREQTVQAVSDKVLPRCAFRSDSQLNGRLVSDFCHAYSKTRGAYKRLRAAWFSKYRFSLPLSREDVRTGTFTRPGRIGPDGEGAVSDYTDMVCRLMVDIRRGSEHIGQ